jgi:hypothetical protein
MLRFGLFLLGGVCAVIVCVSAAAWESHVLGAGVGLGCVAFGVLGGAAFEGDDRYGALTPSFWGVTLGGLVSSVVFVIIAQTL